MESIDRYRQIRFQNGRHVDNIHIHQWIAAYSPVTNGQVLVAGLEVGYAIGSLFEVYCHKAVQIVGHIRLVEFVTPDALVLQNITYLTYLGMEVQPFLWVIADKHVMSSLLCDNQEGADICVFPAFEIAEVALGKELHILWNVMVVALLTKDVLLLQGITLSKWLHDICQYVAELHIWLGIHAETWHRVSDFKYNRTIALLRPKDGVQVVPFCIVYVL